MNRITKLLNYGAALAFYYTLFTPTERLIRRSSSVGRAPFFDPELFPWVRSVEHGWRAIREELDRVLEDRDRIPGFHEISPDQDSITQDRRWKTFLLYAYGRKVEENCRRCPETTRLLTAIPRMKTAFFSILSPGKRIPEHRGPYAGVLRYHLGLVVPADRMSCWIRVGDQVAHWGEGESLVFDDTYPHEVHNDTTSERVVLFVDFARPLPPPVRLVNEAVIGLIGHSPLVQRMIDGVEQWNRRVDAAEPDPPEASAS